jgi:signal transduction histidine kinase
MAELTDQMLAFSGKTWLSPTPLALGEHARSVRERLDPDVAFVWSIVDDTPPVYADGEQFARVTEALMRNAVEALHGAKGTVSVSTGSAQLSRTELDRLAIGRDAAPGRFAYLEIADTGRGMDEQVVARMFEPFFTTKFTGRGLGLASVEGLIRAHRGALAVHSVVGRGTRVRVMLPAAA